MEYNQTVRDHLGSSSLTLQRLRDELAANENPDSDGFSLGVEEEYFLLEASTGQVARSVPESLFEEARTGTDGRIEHELLRAQAETVTRPCTSLRQVRAELRFARGVLSSVAAQHGFAIAAAGTHPTAQWRGTVCSDEERYDLVMRELQMIGERNMLCGMHVHVAVPDPSRRVEVMRRILPFLPLFIALATSSPFWCSSATGLKGYRLSAYDELPRTGLPELFESNEDYQAYCKALTEVGAIPDASHLWWAIRPSHKYPTLELRAPDSCTRLEDAVALAALYRALVRHLYVNPDCNAEIDALGRALAVENKWRAQRYGVQGSFATKDGKLTVAEFLEKTIALTAEDAELLGCTAEIEQCRTIVKEGTSADRQLAIYRELAGSEGPDAALAAVTRWIADTTSEVS
jgi:carboxylate-amine ligase